ncbi:hypothetical protein HBH69_034630 [Parastagonospora nodorum]|nr:hypothetical protein HBH69_034630 [Parastagonospora nodorum]KAH5221485.1 hypothetical protein HBH68_036060 [Parastagonospora nodorum]KAH5456316.1 hypothetical protein HBI30_083930 [Parastagonospora nodorum]KAH5790262.1 hypothetical protein HBI97_054100 [Parastagonospora nodorum]KAH5795238.1 hypothetical protein HBI96_177220 [Parastagonospora nodorum]
MKTLDVPQNLTAILAVWDWERKVYGWGEDITDVPDPKKFVKAAGLCGPDCAGNGRGNEVKSLKDVRAGMHVIL